MNLSYSTAILQERAWRLCAEEQLVLMAWLPVSTREQILCEYLWLTEGFPKFVLYLEVRSPHAKLSTRCLRGLALSYSAIKGRMFASTHVTLNRKQHSPIFFFSSSSSPSVKMYVCRHKDKPRLAISSSQVTQVHPWITSPDETGICEDRLSQSGLIRTHCLGFTPWKT